MVFQHQTLTFFSHRTGSMKWINKTANNETYILIPRDLE